MRRIGQILFCRPCKLVVRHRRSSILSGRSDSRRFHALRRRGALVPLTVDLLILDDGRLQPLDAQASHDLLEILEILEDRYRRKSTIVTSHLDVASWHQAIGDATYSDAILDRLRHSAHRMELAGDSMRRSKPTLDD